MYANVKSLVKRFAGEKDGATLVEYALVVGLVSVAAILTLGALNAEIRAELSQIITALQGT